MHHDDFVDIKTKKPDVILFYNDTKASVDALDQKCANYITSRRTTRWPMTVFHTLLNVGGVNTRDIVTKATPSSYIMTQPRIEVQTKLAPDTY